MTNFEYQNQKSITMNSNTLRTEIKKRLELTLCPTHQKHPTIIVTDKGISIQACCTEFQEQTAQYARIVAKEIRDEIAGELGGVIS